jgi:hypothetical protein
VLVVFSEFLVAFAAIKADLSLDLGIVAHRGKAAVLVLYVKRSDGDAFGDFIKVVVIAAIWTGNLHFGVI